ncbi:MAG: hypothetical protein RMK01_10840 [Thermomicrobium sp.]|nr:hypothetical protein [Thermomicrobium sp.]MDW8060558.1 hypothetical protein [Thermomicrobium sp.]
MSRSGSPRERTKRTGLLLAFLLVLAGILSQLVLARWLGSSLFVVSSALLAAIPLIVAVAGFLWLVRRFRSVDRGERPRERR